MFIYKDIVYFKMTDQHLRTRANSIHTTVFVQSTLAVLCVSFMVKHEI